MTKMLDIIEDYAGMRQYSFCRLDGSVSLVDRQEQVGSYCGCSNCIAGVDTV